MTDDASKVPREDRPDSCLHCVLMTAMEKWFERHGEHKNGTVVVDILHAISKFEECVAEMAGELPDRSQRRRAIRFAHDAVDAAVKSQQTGKLVEVTVPVEH